MEFFNVLLWVFHFYLIKIWFCFILIHINAKDENESAPQQVRYADTDSELFYYYIHDAEVIYDRYGGENEYEFNDEARDEFCKYQQEVTA